MEPESKDELSEFHDAREQSYASRLRKAKTSGRVPTVSFLEEEVEVSEPLLSGEAAGDVERAPSPTYDASTVQYTGERSCGYSAFTWMFVLLILAVLAAVSVAAWKHLSTED